MAQKKSQQKGPPKEFRSPRSGCAPKNPHRLKPGETANPAGSSAKQRMRAAFERLVNEEAANGHVETLLKVAKDESHPQYAQAVAKLHAVLGLTDVEAQNVVVKTELALEDRRDGSKPQILVKTTAETKRMPMRGDSDNVVEIEV